MTVKITYEDKDSKAEYTYYKVESIDIKEGIITIKQKDSEFRMLKMKSDCITIV